MGNTTSQRAGNSPRSWEAQGNATDRGRAPAGVGSSNRPTSAPVQSARMSDANRPPWARGDSQTGAPSGQSSRPSTPNYNSNRPTSSNNGRSYEPPQRSQPSNNNNRGYSQPSYNNNRGNSQPRSYNSPSSGSYSAPRTYSAPSPGYPAPSGSYSAPSGRGRNRGNGASD